MCQGHLAGTRLGIVSPGRDGNGALERGIEDLMKRRLRHLDLCAEGEISRGSRIGTDEKAIIRPMVASSDWIVNVGTLVLAAAAVASAIFAALALMASNRVLGAATKEAEATKQLAEVTSAMFAASSLPLLADIAQHQAHLAADEAYELLPAVRVDRDGGVAVSVPTQNVGVGPAVIKRAALNEIDGKGRGIYCGTSVKVVPSGATTIIMTNGTAGSDSSAPPLATLVTKQFCAIIDYSDYSGERNRRTVLYIIPIRDGTWFIRGVDLHECDKEWNIIGSPIIQDRG